MTDSSRFLAIARSAPAQSDLESTSAVRDLTVLLEAYRTSKTCLCGLSALTHVIGDRRLRCHQARLRRTACCRRTCAARRALGAAAWAGILAGIVVDRMKDSEPMPPAFHHGSRRAHACESLCLRNTKTTLAGGGGTVARMALASAGRSLDFSA